MMLIPLSFLISVNSVVFISLCCLRLDEILHWEWAYVFIPLWGVLLCFLGLLIFYWPGLTQPKVGMQRQAGLCCMYLIATVISSALLLIKLQLNDIDWRYVFFGFWASALVHTFWNVWNKIYIQQELVLLGYAMMQSFMIFIKIELIGLHLFIVFAPTWALFGYWVMSEIYSYLANQKG